MSNPLVSLIIPCYNAEKYIGRMLDSIIMQHYTPFELILINDGSTDNTDAVIQQYLPLLKKNNIDVVYKIQENLGQAAAVDNALKIFTGDYLCWADADDYFEPDAFIERVNFLEKHPEYAVVTSDAYLRPAEDLSKFEKASINYSNRHEPNQFSALVENKSFLCSGCHMVRSSEFLKVHPQRNICRSRGGQNWALLFPVYYKYKSAFLDKQLYNYILYPHSHSHGDFTMQQKLDRIQIHQDTFCEILASIEKNQKVDLSKYRAIALNHYTKKRMLVYCEFQEKSAFYKELKKKKEQWGLNFEDYILVLKIILGSKISMFIYNLLHPKNILKF